MHNTFEFHIFVSLINLLRKMSTENPIKGGEFIIQNTKPKIYLHPKNGAKSTK